MSKVEEEWVQVQKRGFTKWANVYLGMRQMHIDDLYKDLASGVLLINLLEIISGEKSKKYTKKPKMRIQQLENVGIAFRVLQKKGVKLTNSSPQDIVDGNPKIILGLMWTLISKLQVADIKLDGVSGKEGLLLWFQRQILSYELKVSDFSESFKSGLPFLALLHKYRPAMIPYEELLASEDPAKCLEVAFTAGKEVFGVEPLLEPQDIVNSRRPDEKIIVCYVSFLFQAIAEMARNDQMVKSIHKALNLRRQHDTWIAQYLTSVANTKSWLEDATARYKGKVEGGTLDGIKETLDKLVEFRKADKTEAKASLASQRHLLSTLASSQRNSGRPQYSPPEGCSPEAVDELWRQMEELESNFEARVRAKYAQFEVVENTLARFRATASKVVQWVDKQNAVFGSGELGSSAVDTETLLEAYAAYEQQMKHYHETISTLQSWLTAEAVGEHEGHEPALGRLEEVKSLMAHMQEVGEAYKDALHSTLAEHQRLIIVAKEYNAKASDFMFAVDEFVEDMLHQPIPTVSEAAVAQLIEEFDADTPARLAELEAKFGDITQRKEELEAKGVDAFKRFPPLAVDLKLQSARDSSTTRREQLAAAKVAEGQKEVLRVEFAALAAQFKAYCEAKQEECAGLEGELEAQLADVQRLQAEYGDQQARLDAVNAAAAKLDEAKVVNNPHTPETIHSLLAIWEELGKYLQATLDTVQGLLIAKRSGGLTPEMVKEFREVFDYFDVDKDDNLNPDEFYSCTTGIGLVFTEEQMKEAFSSIDLSGDGLIDFDEFTTFMMDRMKEPGAAPEDVQTAFDRLSKSPGLISAADLKRHFITFPGDAEYMAATMAPAVTEEGSAVGGDMKDTAAFVAHLFER